MRVLTFQINVLRSTDNSSYIVCL